MRKIYEVIPRPHITAQALMNQRENTQSPDKHGI